MIEFYHFYKERNQDPLKNKGSVRLPIIYGLTASPVLDISIKDCMKDDSLMEKKLKELCTNMDSKLT